MHYYLYEIKNTVNGKIYVGVHKTKSLDDGYMGSGKVVSNAIRKYGIDHFTKTILETFDNPTAMFAREKEVVNDEFLARADVYNLRRGGTGGFDYINKEGLNNAGNNGIKGALASNARRKSDPNIAAAHKSRASNTLKKLHADGKVPHANFSGKSHSASTKEQMRLVKLGKRTGVENSQYGTCWIYCEWLNKSVKIKKELIPYYLDQGWVKGRKV